jgi:hypothetical protein
MWNRSIFLIALPFALLAQTSRVPFVGCESVGQAKVIEAPKGVDQVVQINAGAVQGLAYYKEGWRGTGALAPLDWHCAGYYGSSGSFLNVTPETVRGKPVFPDNDAIGAIIQLDYISSDNGSGSYKMAEVLARIFPDQKTYIRRGADISDPPGNQVPFGPFPHDELVRRSDHLVHYRTPAHSEGLGTMNGLKANGNPIDTLALFREDTRWSSAYLLMLRVRLPRELRDLAPVIIHDLLLRQRRDAR